MSDQIHYFAFSLKGWSAHKNLGDCIDRQLRANGGCHAVVEVQAPINALYSITGFLPMKFYDTSPFKPGEYVRITPVAASHNDVAEDLRAKCKDTTEWTTEKWREYANLCMLLEEEQQADAQRKCPVVVEVKAPFLTSINGSPCAWEDILPHMPQGIVCYVANEEDWLHVEPGLAIVTKYNHDTHQYMCVDGSTYNYADPALPNECTLNIATAMPPSPVDIVNFGTVNEEEDPLSVDNDNDTISKF